MQLTSHLPRNCDLQFFFFFSFQVFILSSCLLFSFSDYKAFYFILNAFIYLILLFITLVLFHFHVKIKHMTLSFCFQLYELQSCLPAIHRQFFTKTVCNQSSKFSDRLPLFCHIEKPLDRLFLTTAIMFFVEKSSNYKKRPVLRP